MTKEDSILFLNRMDRIYFNCSTVAVENLKVYKI